MVRHDLTLGDERSHLLRLAAPMVWGILAIMSMNLADTFFVGQLGTDELAAMGFTFPVVSVLFSIAFGVGIGASSVIARAIGSKQGTLVRSYTSHSILIALLVAIAFAAAGLASIEPVFTLLGAPPRLLPLIEQYMAVWYLGCFLIVVPVVGNSAIRAAGDSRLPSYVMVTIAVVNAILDPLLIFGWFGLPRLELQGAALATVIAYSASFAVALYVLGRKLGFLCWAGCRTQAAASWRAILRIALPATGTNLIAPLSVAITTWLVAGFGAAAVAGFGVASRIESMCLIVLFALSAVMGPFVGQNWGAGRLERINRAVSIAHRFSYAWGALIAVLLWLTARPLAGAFSDDPSVIDAATRYLHILPISFTLLGVVMIASSVANGMGAPLPALIMTFMRLFVVYLPAAWLLAAWWRLDGIYYAAAFANVAVGAGALAWVRTRCGRSADSFA